MTGAMGSHQSAKAISTTWLTPLSLVRSLGRFDLDPCGHPGWKTADHLICLPEDGLTAEWVGRVWLNPPYGAEVWRWLAKLAAHNRGTALIFARTETAGFTREVWAKASALLFLDGRLHFHRPDGTRAPANAGAPSVLVAYGRDDAVALSLSGLPGSLVTCWRQEPSVPSPRSAAPNPAPRPEAIQRVRGLAEAWATQPNDYDEDTEQLAELLAEVDRLARWKAEAFPVITGLQELGAALGIRLGGRITGPDALAAVKALTARAEAAEQAVQRVRGLAGELRAKRYLAPTAMADAILRALDGAS